MRPPKDGTHSPRSSAAKVMGHIAFSLLRPLLTQPGGRLRYLPWRGITQSRPRMWTNWSLQTPLPGPSLGRQTGLRRLRWTCLETPCRRVWRCDASAPDGSAGRAILERCQYALVVGECVRLRSKAATVYSAPPLPAWELVAAIITAPRPRDTDRFATASRGRHVWLLSSTGWVRSPRAIWVQCLFNAEALTRSGPTSPCRLDIVQSASSAGCAAQGSGR